jgi:predicted small secreted protein
MRANLRSLLLSFLLLTSAGLALGACHTVHGAGEDIERSSDAVKKKL